MYISFVSPLKVPETRKWKRRTWLSFFRCANRHEKKSIELTLMSRPCPDEILQDGKVGHGSVHHRCERVVVVAEFSNDDVTSPSVLLVEVRALDVANALVDGEGHSIARNGGVVDDVRVGEFLVHHVQRVDDEVFPRLCPAEAAGLGNKVHVRLRVRHARTRARTVLCRARHELDNGWRTAINGEGDDLVGSELVHWIE